MNDLISVVIPAYNAAAFISNTLDSVLSQSYRDFEVVIVNDGSIDNTLEIINEYAKKDSRVRVFSQENGGVSAARNTALTKVKGKYITYVDADDSLPEKAFENLISLMSDDVDMVVGSHNEVRIGKTPHLETPLVLDGSDIKNNFRKYDSVVWWPWGKLLRTSIILDNKLSYDTSITFGEDHIFNLLYAKHIKGKVVVSDKIVYNYHYIRGGLCSKYYANMNALQKYVYLKIEDFFGGHDSTPYEIRSLYAGAYLKGLVDYYAAWLSFSKASEKIKESFEMYSDIIDDETVKKNFSQKEFELYKAGDFKAFTKDYMISNPKKTVFRKGKRYVRRFLELQQKIFLKRK